MEGKPFPAGTRVVVVNCNNHSLPFSPPRPCSRCVYIMHIGTVLPSVFAAPSVRRVLLDNPPGSTPAPYIPMSDLALAEEEVSSG